jgi:hypothetical protein
MLFVQIKITYCMLRSVYLSINGLQKGSRDVALVQLFSWTDSIWPSLQFYIKLSFSMFPRAFSISNFTITIFKCWILLKSALWAWTVLVFFLISHEQAQSNQICNIFNFFYVGRSLVIPFFSILQLLFISISNRLSLYMAFI